MPADIEFSFHQLSNAARRHIRIFQIHQSLDRFAMGLTVAVVALTLIERGMDLFQISMLFGVYSVTTMAMELPFGGLAENIGRNPVFLSAVVASLISLGLFLSSNDFYVLALSFAFIGFGRALRSGTLDAWFVENFKTKSPDVDIQPALAKAQWANAMGLAFGAICGGLLPDAFGDMAITCRRILGRIRAQYSVFRRWYRDRDHWPELGGKQCTCGFAIIGTVCRKLINLAVDLIQHIR